MIDFETKTLVKNGKILIQNGQAINGHVLSDKTIALSDIESLYADYETSFPDKPLTSMFYAKPESELKLSEMVYNKTRSETQELLEQTLLEGILNKSLVYPNPEQWFWQSKIHENLILPRWLFTEECHRKIAYQPQPLDENMLWDKNLVGKRLRKAFQSEKPPEHIPISFKDCFCIAKEELMEHKRYKYVSENAMNLLLSAYMKSIKKQNKKADTGQYVSRIRQAKTTGYQLRAIDDLIENAYHLTRPCLVPAWQNIYTDFIDEKTLLFIEAFIPDAKPLQISGRISDYTEHYICDNLAVIKEYIDHH